MIYTQALKKYIAYGMLNGWWDKLTLNYRIRGRASRTIRMTYGNMTPAFKNRIINRNRKYMP